MGSVLLVHGTGVRLPSYQQSFLQARAVASQVGVLDPIYPCAWGDCLGVSNAWKSLPSNSVESAQDDDLEKWSWLFESPNFELMQYTPEVTGLTDAAASGFEHEGHDQLRKLREYVPSQDLRMLLERGGLLECWDRVWEIASNCPVVTQAFENYDRDLDEVTRAFSRSVVAQLHNEAIFHGLAGPSLQLRSALVNRLLVDFDQFVLGGSFLGRLAAQATTYCVRKNRLQLSRASALIIGDILLYQSKGEQLRNYLKGKIMELTPPVTIVAHSLGGIAMVDLLAMEGTSYVKGLVTVGSQSPFLNELGALQSLRTGDPLPKSFPRWLNIYDQNDFLSFRARPIWGEVQDHEVVSGQPFPDSHLAYFGNVDVWDAIKGFIR